jgi:hypothetical protein
MPNEDDSNYESYKTKIDKELKKINNREDIAGMFFIGTPFGDLGRQYEGFTLNNELASRLTLLWVRILLDICVSNRIKFICLYRISFGYLRIKSYHTQ